MTKIIVLAVEEDGQVGITTSDGLSADGAFAVCTAAVRHFQEQLIEAEVQRRLTEKPGKEKANDGD